MDVFDKSVVLMRVLLTLIFLRQCYVAFDKLVKETMGTSESTGHEPLVLYPSISFCPLWPHFTTTVVPEDERNLTAAELRLREKLPAFGIKNITQKYQDENGERQTIVIKPENIEKFAEEGTVEEFVAASILEGTNYLQSCLTYNPPGKSKPGIEGKLHMFLRSAGVYAWFAFVHNRGGFQYSLNNNFGTTFVYLMFSKQASHPGNKVKMEVYEVYRERQIWMDSDKNPCQAQGSVQADIHLWKCAEEYVEGLYECRLPWRRVGKVGANRPICDTVQDYDNVVAKLRHLSLLAETNFTETTGCLPKCDRFSYTARVVSDYDTDTTEEDLTYVTFAFSSGSYVVKEQFDVYDFSSFWSDVGGFLGLLLGHSILSIYADFAGWIGNVCKRQKS